MPGAKLTLKLDKGIIERAKEYASETNQSLSRLVEGYFLELTSSKKFKQNLSPRVRKVSGVLKGKSVDYKNSASNYLIEKYSDK